MTRRKQGLTRRDGGRPVYRQTLGLYRSFVDRRKAVGWVTWKDPGVASGGSPLGCSSKGQELRLLVLVGFAALCRLGEQTLCKLRRGLDLAKDREAALKLGACRRVVTMSFISLSKCPMNCALIQWIGSAFRRNSNGLRQGHRCDIHHSRQTALRQLAAVHRSRKSRKRLQVMPRRPDTKIGSRRARDQNNSRWSPYHLPVLVLVSARTDGGRGPGPEFVLLLNRPP